MQVRCPYCQTGIEVETSGQYTCRQCRAIFKVDLGGGEAPPARAPSPAPAPAPALSPSPEPAPSPERAPASSAAPPTDRPTASAGAPGAPPGAHCARHPDREAIDTCVRCGNYLCGLCSLPLAQGRHCPDCAERVRSTERSTPWEKRKELGAVPAFKETIRLVMREPTRFFKRMPREGGYESPLLFFIVLNFISAIAQTVTTWGWVVAGIPVMGPGTEGAEIMIPIIGQTVGMLVCAPIMAVIAAFIAGAIFHVGLMVLGGANSPFETTVRVYSYANSPGILMIAIAAVTLVTGIIGRVVGGPIGGYFGGVLLQQLAAGVVGIWSLVLLVIGFREAHDTTTGRAVGAVLLPIGALVCCVGALAGAVALMLARAGP